MAGDNLGRSSHGRGVDIHPGMGHQNRHYPLADNGVYRALPQPDGKRPRPEVREGIPVLSGVIHEQAACRGICIDCIASDGNYLYTVSEPGL